MDGAVIVAAIGALTALAGTGVARSGYRAELRQRAVEGRVAREHVAYEELKGVAEMRAQDNVALREENRLLYEDMQECRATISKLHDDLKDLAKVVMRQVEKEASDTAEAIRQKEHE